MAEIRCAECGRRYESKSGLRRHVRSVHRGSATRAEPGGGAAQLLKQALRALGVRREDVLSYRITETEVVVIEGPVGYKRVYTLPPAGEVEG